MKDGMGDIVAGFPRPISKYQAATPRHLAALAQVGILGNACSFSMMQLSYSLDSLQFLRRVLQIANFTLIYSHCSMIRTILTNIDVSGSSSAT